MGFANVSKQSGSKDGGLFSIANRYSFGLDPSLNNQKCSEVYGAKKMEPFPAAKNHEV